MEEPVHEKSTLYFLSFR